MSLYPPPSAPYPLYVAYPALVALAAFRCPPPTAVDVGDVVAVAEPEEEEDEEEEVEEEVKEEVEVEKETKKRNEIKIFKRKNERKEQKEQKNQKKQEE